MWHALILQTRLYADLQQALGCVLHHRPEGASDQEAASRGMRLRAMEGLYGTFLSFNPLRSPTGGYLSAISISGRRNTALDPRFVHSSEINDSRSTFDTAHYLYGITVTVKELTGTQSTYNVVRSLPVKGLKDGISMKTGHAAEHILLTFEGMALEDDGTFEDYSIINGSTLHQILDTSSDRASDTITFWVKTLTRKTITVEPLYKHAIFAPERMLIERFYCASQVSHVYLIKSSIPSTQIHFYLNLFTHLQ